MAFRLGGLGTAIRSDALSEVCAKFGPASAAKNQFWLKCMHELALPELESSQHPSFKPLPKLVPSKKPRIWELFIQIPRLPETKMHVGACSGLVAEPLSNWVLVRGFW